MVAAVNFNGHFSNQSLEGETPRGIQGKLNPEQIKIRARKHALRMATGKPTVAEIADFWMKEYGISMSYYGEKEWAVRNEDAITAASIELIESGELKNQPFTESHLLNTLKVSGQETGKVIRKIERHLLSLLDSVDIEFDPMKVLGYTVEDITSLDPASRKMYDELEQRENAKNKLRLKVIETYAAMLKDQKKILLDTVGVANGLYQSSEARMKHIDKQIQHTVGEILTEKDKTEFDPEAAEITDADRERVLGRKDGES